MSYSKTLAKTHTLVAGMLAASVAAAHAAAAPYSAAFQRCSTPYRDDATLHGCLADEYARQDRTLNESYRAVMARLSPARQETLRAQERNWIKTTKKRCEDAGPDNDGSDAPLIIDKCYIDATRLRIGIVQQAGS